MHTYTRKHVKLHVRISKTHTHIQTHAPEQMRSFTHTLIHTHINSSIEKYTHIQIKAHTYIHNTHTQAYKITRTYKVHTIYFHTCFVWALLLIVHTWNSCPLRSNLPRLQCTCCTVPTTSSRPYGSPLVWSCQWSPSQPLSSPQLSHNDSLWAKGITKSHREHGLDYRDSENLSWCSSCSNSLWQGWGCGLVYCPCGNATDPIWRVLVSSDGIFCWTPLKPQHSNPNPLANQLWCIEFLTPPTPLIIPHRLLGFLESLMPLKSWCSIYARWSKSSLKHSICFCGIL